jgi:hypothetical protein
VNAILGPKRPRLSGRPRPTLWVALVAVAASSLVGATIAVGADSRPLAVPNVAWGLILLGAVLLCVIALHQRVRLWELSPVAVLVLTYLAVAFLGPLWSTAASVGLGASAQIDLSAEESYGTYLIFMVGAGAALVGALVFALLTKPLPVPSTAIGGIPASWRKPAALFAMAPAVLTILLYRDALLERPVYLLADLGSPLSIAAQVLAIPAVITLGWLAKTSRTARAKVLTWAGILTYTALLFSMGTRAFSLIPVLVALGMLAADPSSKWLRVAVLFAALASIVLLQTPLALRGSSEHGLIPYITRLFDGSPGAPGLDSAVSNILFSYALTGAVAYHAPPIAWSWFLISIDPRPGQFTDWYAIEPLLRVNAFTPDNALGELANHGLWMIVGSFLVVGAFFAYLDGRIRQLLSTGPALGGLLLFALAGFFVLETLQYNLRSSSRIIYYLIAADLGLRVIGWTRRRNPATRMR